MRQMTGQQMHDELMVERKGKDNRNLDPSGIAYDYAFCVTDADPYDIAIQVIHDLGEKPNYGQQTISDDCPCGCEGDEEEHRGPIGEDEDDDGLEDVRRRLDGLE